MPTLQPESHIQSAAKDYGVVWKLWPETAVVDGQRQNIGFEAELIGSHTSDPGHFDPACSMCSRVRSVLLDIVSRMIDGTSLNTDIVTFDVDPHQSTVICYPGLGNHSFVSVSINVLYRNGNGRSIEAPLVNDIKEYLAQCGVYQR